ncbi:MAG: hypothetical protein H6590_03540 [Flavobacteriales bacterium]|nr:hypothetical protein [Flavobacteriales bacterium]
MALVTCEGDTGADVVIVDGEHMGVLCADDRCALTTGDVLVIVKPSRSHPHRRAVVRDGDAQVHTGAAPGENDRGGEGRYPTSGTRDADHGHVGRVDRMGLVMVMPSWMDRASFSMLLLVLANATDRVRSSITGHLMSSMANSSRTTTSIARHHLTTGCRKRRYSRCSN